MKGQEIDYFFDINKFEKNRNGSEWNFQKNDAKIRQIKENTGYRVEVTIINSGYTYINVYDINGAIKIKAVRFYGNDVGQWLYYNNKQQVIKKIDNDVLYVFSIDALAELLKSDNIDLYDSRQIYMMQRYVDSENLNEPLYVVYVYQPDDLNKSDLMSYLISGKTGNILFKRKSYLRDETNIYNEYIKTTREYKEGIYKIEDE